MNRLLLSAVLVMSAMSLGFAQLTKPSFDVVSVKLRDPRAAIGPPGANAPNAFYRANATVNGLIRFAYEVAQFQIVGGPEWILKEEFEVNARASGPVRPETLRLMVQSLLEERFKLVSRTEPRRTRYRAVLIDRPDGRLGPNLQQCGEFGDTPRTGPTVVPRGGMPLTGSCVPITSIASVLAAYLQSPVIDRTGLTGTWNYEVLFSDPVARASSRPADAPGLSTALRENLGLKLEPSEGPVDFFVIDSVQRPNEN